MQQIEADGGGPRVGLAFCCVASCLRQISQVCVRSRKYVTGNRTKGKVVGDGRDKRQTYEEAIPVWHRFLTFVFYRDRLIGR